MVAVAGTLLNQTQGRVLLNALLPRGDGNKRKKAAPVVGSAADGSPVRSFSPLITKVNAGLRSWAEADTSRRVGARGISFFRTIALLHCRRTRLAASGRAASFFFRPPFRPTAGGRVSGRDRAISFLDCSPSLSCCLQADAARRVGFVDCGGPFRRGEHDVQRDLMPDSLRPSLDVEPRWQGREGKGGET